MLKYKVNKNNLDNNLTFSILLDKDVDNSASNDLVNNNFVETNKNKSINGIVDYEKVNYNPIDTPKQIIFDVDYTYEDLGFDDEDIDFKSNALKLSHLQLNFYDSPLLGANNLLYVKNIYINYDLFETNKSDVIKFNIENPNNFNKVNNSDGYNIIYFKDIINNGPFNLYMRARFNNAKDGNVYNLFTNDYGSDNTLYTLFQLKKTNDNYLYDIIGGNIEKTNTDYIINLKR